MSKKMNKKMIYKLEIHFSKFMKQFKINNKLKKIIFYKMKQKLKVIFFNKNK